MEILRKSISALLALVMVVTMLPISALAEETAGDDALIVPETTAETEPVDVGDGVLDVPLADETLPETTAPEVFVEETAEAVATSGTCGENMTWELDEAGILTLSGVGYMPSYYDDYAPWHYSRGKINKVIIEEGIEGIGDRAFYYCYNLTSIELPESLEYIGKFAFEDCTSLTEIQIPQSVRWINSCAFSGCTGIVHLALPSGLERLTLNMLSGMSGLKRVYIPQSVAEIEMFDEYAGIGPFGYYDAPHPWIYTDALSQPKHWPNYWNRYQESGSGLMVYYGYTLADFECWWDFNQSNQSHVISTEVTKFPDDFINAPESMQAVYLGTVEQWKRMAINRSANCSDGFCEAPFAAGSSGGTRWILDNSNVLYIAGKGELYNSWSKYNTYIAKIVIGEGITATAGTGFGNCPNLTSIEIPATLTAFVGSTTFGGCSSLREVYISDLRTWCTMEFGYSRNPLGYGADLYLNGELVTELVLPDGLEAVNEGSFRGCTSITKVVVPEGVEEIGDNAFRNCYALAEVVLPSTLKSIGEYAFYQNDLTKVELPDGLERIDEYAFASTNIETVNFPRSVNVISKGAFSGWNMKEICFQHNANDMLMIGMNAFYYDGYKSQETIVRVADKEQPHSAITGYDWAGSNRTMYLISGTDEHEHKMVVYSVTEPTCTEKGYTTYVCDCGESYVDNYTDALGHTEVIDKAIEATCTESGKTEGKHCSVCNTVIVAQTEIPATGHSFGNWYVSKEASTEAEGEERRDCACGHYEAKAIPKIPTEGKCGEELAWNYDKATSTLTITGSGAMWNFTISLKQKSADPMVPWAAYQSEIKKVVLSEGITYIGSNAFAGCGNLKEIIFQGDAPAISETAFENVSATVSYPQDNETWSEDKMQDFGGDLTWAKPENDHGYDLGDVNHDNKINAKDATLILQKSVGVLKESAKFCETCAEVSGDGKLNAKDSTLILQFSVGLRDHFPAQEK